MNLLRNTLKLFFVYCPILIVLFFLGFSIQNNINSILNNIEPVVSKSATEIIGVPCSVDKIQISNFGINLKNVSIKDKKHNEFIKAENIWIYISPININVKEIKLKEVKIDNASVNIYRDKDWNFLFLNELSKKFKTDPTNIIGPIFLITNSKVNIYDSKTKFKDNINDINIRINLKNEQNPSIIANFNSNYIENVRYYTYFDRAKHIANIKSNIKNVNLNAFNEFKNLIPKNQATDIINNSFLYGYSNINLSATLKNRKLKEYSIETINNDISLYTPYGNLSKTNINAVCINDILKFKAKGFFNSSETFVEGSLNIKKPKDIQGNLTVKNITPEYFKKIIPNEYASIKGSLDMSASISGSINNPNIYLNAKANDINYNGLKLKTLTLKTKYSNENADYELYIKNKDKNIEKTLFPYNGEIFAKGNISHLNLNNFNLNKLSTNSIISLRKFDLSSIPYCNGTAQGDINIQGYVLNPIINSNCTIHNGMFKYKKFSFNNLIVAISVNVINNKLILNSGLIRGIYNTDIICKGEIDKKLNGNLSIDFNKLSLKQLGHDLDLNINGEMSISSSIKKFGEKITNNNLINIQNLEYNNQSIKHIQGNIQLNNKGIILNEVHILDFPATFTIYGIITPNRDYLIPYNTAKYILNKEEIKYKEKLQDKLINLLSVNYNKKAPLYFDIDLNCNNYSTKSLFNRLNINNDNLKAITNGNISLKGKLYNNKISELEGNGTVKINDLNIYDYPFSNITAKLNIENDIVFLSELQGKAVSINTNEVDVFGNISGTGKYNYITGHIEGSIKLNNININDFRKYFKDYVSLYGFVNTEFSINGIVNKEIQDINASISSTMPILNINGKSYRDLKLTCNLQHSDLISANLNMTKDQQSLNANLKDFSIKNKNIENLNFYIKDMEINDLREIFYLSPIAKLPNVAKILDYVPIVSDGKLNLVGNFNGKIEEINGHIELNTTNINADFDKISKIYAKVIADKGKINIDTFEIYGSEFVLFCDGNIYKENLNLNLNLANLPIERFNKYLKFKNLSGNLVAHALIKGNYKKPSIEANFELNEPQINNVKFLSLESKKIIIDPEYINLNEGMTVNFTDNNKMLITGLIPSNILNNPNKEIELNLLAQKQDLDFIELFIPQITKNTTKGEFDGYINVKGNLIEPKISGNFNIDKGEIHTLGNTIINDLSSNINIQNDEKGNLICNADFISKDNNLKENSLNGYGKIILNNIAKEINNSSQKPNIQIEKLLTASSISGEINLSDYYYTAKDFTIFGDNSNTLINGKVFINGNLLNPKIFTNSPIVFNKLKTSIKGSSKGVSENQNTILMMAMKEQEEQRKLFSFNDAVNYDEISSKKEEKNKFLINPSFDIKAITQGAEIRPPATIIKADINVSIEGDLNSPYVNGAVIIQEGKTNFQIARARFIKGSTLDFEFKNWQPNINMNIHAFSHVHYSDKYGFDERYKINIDILGNLDNYEISLTSDPIGLDKHEIIRAFTGFSANNTINAGDTLAKIGATTLLAPIEDVFVEYLGFDSLNFEYKQNEYAIINIERSINNKFYGSFYSNLYDKNKSVSNYINNNIYTWELRFGYKLDNRFRVNIGINNDKEFTNELTYGFRF